MRKYNISVNLVRIFEQLHDKTINAVQIHGPRENGSDQHLELNKDVFCHPPSSTFSRLDYA